MNQEFIEFLENTIPKIIEEGYLFDEIDEYKGWYLERKYFLEQNDILLSGILNLLNHKFNLDYSLEDLFFMEKLFLMYPDTTPQKLLSLSWEHVKIILNLCDEKKRKFYIDLCCEFNVESSKLKDYILNDLYEKVELLILEIQDYDEVTSDDFTKKVLEIYPMVWK